MRALFPPVPHNGRRGEGENTVRSQSRQSLVEESAGLLD